MSRLLQRQLQRLARDYAKELPANVEMIATGIQQLLAQSADSETGESVRQHLHRLKGSGTTLGFDDVSETARVLEALLASALGQTVPLSADQRTEMHRAIADLRAVARRARQSIVDDKSTVPTG